MPFDPSQIIFTDVPALERKARLALAGPAGSGKTYTGLQILGQLIEPGQFVAVIDTERESARLHKREVKVPFKWFNLNLHHPEAYIAAIEAAEQAGIFGGLLIDSLSHAWMGNAGALELVDRVSARTGSKNNFFAWREVTPMHNALVDKLLSCRLHLLVTMRTKTEYRIEEYDEKGFKKLDIRKVGLQPIQRDGLEYEFDVIGDLFPETNRLVIGKTRCSPLAGKVFVKDGITPGKIIRTWLRDLAETPSAEPARPAPAPAIPDATIPWAPAPEALCQHYIDQVREAKIETIIAIKDAAKAALGFDKKLLAKFHAAYTDRYNAIVPRPEIAAS